MRLLLLEDDYRLRQAYGSRLRSDGHAVDEAVTLAQARAALAETDYDCVVLDRLAPDGDAIVLVEEMSGREGRPSVLVLSGLDGVASRVGGLEAGADDYLAKPADLDELVVRVRRLIVRRTPVGSRLRLGRVSVNRVRREVLIDREPIHLTPTQFSVFEQLAINVDHVVDQGTLLDHCWDAQRDPFANPLHSQITRLRSAFRGVLVIETMRGSGYMLRVAAGDEVDARDL